MRKYLTLGFSDSCRSRGGKGESVDPLRTFGNTWLSPLVGCDISGCHHWWGVGREGEARDGVKTPHCKGQSSTKNCPSPDFNGSEAEKILPRRKKGLK